MSTQSERARVLHMIAADTEADAERYDGTPFTGANVAVQLGEIRAAICALANILADVDTP